MEAVGAQFTAHWREFEEGVSNLATKVADVFKKSLSFVCGYDYRTSALYGSSLPLALPISMIGMAQCIRDIIHKVKKVGISAPHQMPLAIFDLIVGISGIVRPFCITVIALSVISKIDPILHATAGPLSLVASIFNSFYALSITIRMILSCKRLAQMRESMQDPANEFHGKSSYHYLADKKNISRKELGYDFQTNGKQIRNLFHGVAAKIDDCNPKDQAAQIRKAEQIFNRRLIHRRVSEALSIVIAVASIVSAVCFFVWAGTFLAPVAWIVALSVCAMSFGKYLYDRRIIQQFQTDLKNFTQLG